MTLSSQLQKDSAEVCLFCENNKLVDHSKKNLLRCLVLANKNFQQAVQEIQELRKFILTCQEKIINEGNLQQSSVNLNETK